MPWNTRDTHSLKWFIALVIRAICIMCGIWKGAADEITHFPTIHESPEDKTYLAPNQWHDKVLQTIKSRRSPTTTEHPTDQTRRTSMALWSVMRKPAAKWRYLDVTEGKISSRLLHGMLMELCPPLLHHSRNLTGVLLCSSRVGFPCTEWNKSGSHPVADKTITDITGSNGHDGPGNYKYCKSVICSRSHTHYMNCMKQCHQICSLCDPHPPPLKRICH